MKIGDIVSTPDGLGEIVEVSKYFDVYQVVLDKSGPNDPVMIYWHYELKLVYSPK